MKKLLAIVVVVTAFAASESFAQATANVTLLVNTALSIAATQSTLNMGSVAAGVTDSVAYTDGGAAFFTVSGTAGTNFTLGWTSTTLNNGTWHLTPRFYIFGNGTNVTTGATQVTNPSSQLTSSGTGNYYFWAGAAVDVPSNAAGGTYNGTVTLTLTLD